MSSLIKFHNHLDEIVNIPIEKIRIRPSTYGIIKNGSKILVLNTKQSQKLWFPGGGVEIGETLHDTLKRECLEETGLILKEIKEMLLFKENFFYHGPSDNAMQAYMFFFLCEAEEGELNSSGFEDNEDIENPRWIEIRDIKKEDINSISEDIYQMLNKLK